MSPNVNNKLLCILFINRKEIILVFYFLCFYLPRKIVLIRPKLTLCNDGNYRELRWFNPWTKLKQFEDHALPEIIQDIAKQVKTKKSFLSFKSYLPFWTQKMTMSYQCLVIYFVKHKSSVLVITKQCLKSSQPDQIWNLKKKVLMFGHDMRNRLC